MPVIVSGFEVHLADRVRETTQTTGTGSYSLDGAATGRRTFVAGIGNGNLAAYTAAMGSNWEVGLGTVTAGAPATLSRDVILSSSNSGNAVNWGAGVKDIFVDVAAAVFDSLQAYIDAEIADLQDQITAAVGDITTLNGLKTQHFGRFDADTLPRDVVIPAGARWIDVGFSNFALSGTGSLQVQLGTSGSPQTSGYASASGAFDNSSQAVFSTAASFTVRMGASSTELFGNMRLMHIGSNLWTQSHSADFGSTTVVTGGGAIAMPGAVDLLRIVAPGGGQTSDGWVGVTVGF